MIGRTLNAPYQAALHGAERERVASTLTRLVPRQMRLLASRWLAGRVSASVTRELATLASRSDAIIAGPWLGEVGFELLYWVPFLAWCAEHFDIAPERWVVVSRGGTASWYRPFANRYADVFEQVSPEEFRLQHDERVRVLGEQKQTRVTAFDERIIQGAATKFGLTSWSVWHPSTMYRLFNPFWWGHLDAHWVRRHTRYRRLPPPGQAGVPLVAPPYVAAKFYFNECFPATPANKAFASRVLRSLADEGPVIALSTGLALDDHDIHVMREAGVRHLPEGLDPAENLRVQDALVAGARAFVGTYGGFSYLAPFHHVPSYAFYSEPHGFSRTHLTLAHAAIGAAGAPGALHVDDVGSEALELPLAAGLVRA